MNIWKLYEFLERNQVSVLRDASKATTPDGSVRYNLIKVQDLGRVFNIPNPAQYFRNIARGDQEERFIEFIKQPSGRPAMYIAEPVLYEFVFTAETPECKALQNWLFEKVLNHIALDGLYTKEMEKDDE